MFKFAYSVDTETRVRPSPRLIAALLATLLVATLSGCGSFDPEPIPDPEGLPSDRPIRQFYQRLIAKSSVPNTWRAGDDCRRNDLIPPPSNLYTMVSSGTNWSCGP